jgi:hypothetical protein
VLSNVEHPARGRTLTVVSARKGKVSAADATAPARFSTGLRLATRKFRSRPAVGWGRRMLMAIFATLVVTGVVATSASALVDPESINKDVEITKSALESNSTLSDFSGLTSEQKLAIERVFGDLEWQNELYRAGSPGEIDSHYGLEYGAEGQKGVEAYETDLEDGTDSVPDDSYTAFDVGGEALDATAGTFGVAGVATVGAAAVSGVAAFAGGYWIGERLMELFSSEQVEKGPEYTFSLGEPIEKAMWVGRYQPESETEYPSCKSFWCWRGGYKQEEIEGKRFTRGATYGLGGPGEHLEKVPSKTAFILMLYEPSVNPYHWLYSGYAAKLYINGSQKWEWGDPQVEESTEEYCEYGGEEYGSLHCIYGFDPYERPADWPFDINNSALDLAGPFEKIHVQGYIKGGSEEHPIRIHTRIHGITPYEVAITRTAAQMPVNFPKAGRKCEEGFECPHTSVPSLSGTSSELVTRLHDSLNGEEEHHNLEKYIDALTEGHGGHELVPGSVEQVAEALKVNNPKTEFAPGASEVIAENCLVDMEEAEYNGISECESLPIFVSGSDVPSATEHDLKALAAYPKWIKLNYESKAAKKAKGEKEGWYVGEEGCPLESPPEGKSCDEYPFFASRQGGPGAEVKPSLEYIKASDNSEQGGKYGNFVSSCKMAERTSTEYAFLAVPLKPSLGVPTITNLCNNGPE